VSRGAANGKLLSIHQRGPTNPYDPVQFEGIVEDVFKKLLEENEYSLGFAAPDEDPETGTPEISSRGITWMQILHGPTTGFIPIFTFLNFKYASSMIEHLFYSHYSNLFPRHYAPLLRNDLDDSERLGMELFTANTLVHEIMVG
jgi:hypothetical protein